MKQHRMMLLSAIPLLLVALLGGLIFAGEKSSSLSQQKANGTAFSPVAMKTCHRCPSSSFSLRFENFLSTSRARNPVGCLCVPKSSPLSPNASLPRAIPSFSSPSSSNRSPWSIIWLKSIATAPFRLLSKMTQRPRKSNDWDVLDRDWGVIPKNPTLEMQHQANERMNADLQAWQEKWAEMDFVENNLLSIKRGSILVGVDMWRDRLEKGFKVKNLRSPHSIYLEYFPSVANRPEAVETYRNAYLLWKATGQMGDDIPESITATNPEDALQEIIDHLKEKEAYDERLTLNKDLAIAMKAQSDLRLAKYRAGREKAAAARAAANADEEDGDDDEDGKEDVPPPWKEAFDEIVQLGGKATILTPANESDLASKVIQFLDNFPDEAGSLDGIWSKFSPRVKMPIRNQLFRSVPITLAMNKYFGLIEMFELSKFFEAEGRELVEQNLEKYYNRFGEDVVGEVESAFEQGMPAVCEYLKVFGTKVANGDEDLLKALRASSIEPDLPLGEDLVVNEQDVLVLPAGKKDARSFPARTREGKYVKFGSGWKKSDGARWIVVENLTVIEKLEAILSLKQVTDPPETPIRGDLVIRDDGIDIGVSGSVSTGITGVRTRSMIAAEDEEVQTVEI